MDKRKRTKKSPNKNCIVDFNFYEDSEFLPRGGEIQLNKIINFLKLLPPPRNDIQFHTLSPHNGLLQFIGPRHDIEVTENYIISLIDTICILYNKSLFIESNSPTLTDVKNDLNDLRKNIFSLYSTLIKTNEYTRKLFHRYSDINHEANQFYVNSMGKGLPREHAFKILEKNLWYKHLDSFTSLIEYIQMEINQFSNPVKGSLFKKEIGSPDFILVWNSHQLLYIFELMMTATKNNIPEKENIVSIFSKLVKTYATGIESFGEWPDEHIVSIVRWRKVLVSTRERIRKIVFIYTTLEKLNVFENELRNLDIELSILCQREAWLLDNPGRLSPEHEVSRGSMAWFTDPTVPLDINAAKDEPLD